MMKNQETEIVKHKTLLKTVVFPVQRTTGAKVIELHKTTMPKAGLGEDLGALPHSTKKQTFFDRFIDKTVDGLSSPKAIYVQTAVTVGYMVVNTVALGVLQKFDPYPFLFLNFIYSLASGYATVFVLNSNRRQEIAAKERSEELSSTIKILVKENKRQSKLLEEFLGIKPVAAKENK